MDLELGSRERGKDGKVDRSSAVVNGQFDEASVLYTVSV
jgi:hypothetical protein